MLEFGLCGFKVEVYVCGGLERFGIGCADKEAVLFVSGGVPGKFFLYVFGVKAGGIC